MMQRYKFFQYFTSSCQDFFDCFHLGIESLSLCVLWWIYVALPMPSTSSYLVSLSNRIYELYQDDLEGLTLIFPTSLARHIFLKSLNKRVKNPCWAPQSLLLDQFMQDLLPRTIPKKLALLKGLYGVLTPSLQGRYSFASFLKWGGALLDDFELIAQYKVAIDALFEEGGQLGAIGDKGGGIAGFWKALEGSSKLIPKDFLALWRVVPDLHRRFLVHLSSHGIAYRGLHYEQVYEGLTNGMLTHGHQRIIVIGLPRITPLVEGIFRVLACSVPVDFYFDVDGYYMDDPAQEAGWHLRKYVGDDLLGGHLQSPYPSYLAEKRARIKRVASVSEVGQTRVIAGELLDLIGKKGVEVLANTAIVLPDPALLIPLLHRLPASIPLVIDRQHPVKETPLYTLLLDILHFRYKMVSGKSRDALLESLEGLFHYAYLSLPMGLKESLRGYFRGGELRIQVLGDLPALWRLLLDSSGEKMNIWRYVGRLCDLLITESGALATWEVCAIEQVGELCEALLDLPGQKLLQSITMVDIQFFAERMQGVSFGLCDKSDGGLRIISLYETVLLDFDYVFVLSMNENVFPSYVPPCKFIPPTLAKSYGLPTISDRKADYAYLFYRLLQRAQAITFVYHEGKRVEKRSEVSYLLAQLQYEADWPMTDDHFVPEVEKFVPKPIIVDKDKVVAESLRSFFQGGEATRSLTPSAINTYLDCSLRFYFRYIAQLPVTLPEMPILHSAYLGRLLHEVMESLYRGYLGETVKLNHIGMLKEKVPTVVEQVLQGSGAAARKVRKGGKVGFMGKVLVALARKILDLDGQEGPFVVKGVEVRKRKTLKGEFPLADGEVVQLGGIIDRVDYTNGITRVVDYKTSVFHGRIESIAALFAGDKEGRNSTALQIFWYGWLYAQEVTTPVQPTVISTSSSFPQKRSLQLHLFDESGKRVQLTDVKPYMTAFERCLGRVLEELFDLEVPFTQTEMTSRCTHCPYKDICQRGS